MTPAITSYHVVADMFDDLPLLTALSATRPFAWTARHWNRVYHRPNVKRFEAGDGPRFLLELLVHAPATQPDCTLRPFLPLAIRDVR